MEKGRKAKTQEQEYKIINKERKRKMRAIITIKVKEWNEYFREML